LEKTSEDEEEERKDDDIEYRMENEEMDNEETAAVAEEVEAKDLQDSAEDEARYRVDEHSKHDEDINRIEKVKPSAKYVKPVHNHPKQKTESRHHKDSKQQQKKPLHHRSEMKHRHHKASKKHTETSSRRHDLHHDKKKKKKAYKFKTGAKDSQTSLHHGKFSHAASQLRMRAATATNRSPEAMTPSQRSSGTHQRKENTTSLNEAQGTVAKVESVTLAKPLKEINELSKAEMERYLEKAEKILESNPSSVEAPSVPPVAAQVASNESSRAEPLPNNKQEEEKKLA